MPPFRPLFSRAEIVEDAGTDIVTREVAASMAKMPAEWADIALLKLIK